MIDPRSRGGFGGEEWLRQRRWLNSSRKRTYDHTRPTVRGMVREEQLCCRSNERSNACTWLQPPCRALTPSEMTTLTKQLLWHASFCIYNRSIILVTYTRSLGSFNFQLGTRKLACS
jgi:hypothetical protein